MPTYDLDDIIADMMAHNETEIHSAEARNTINWARSTHPCCGDRSELERALAVSCAIVGRDVHPVFREKIDRLVRKLRAETNKAAA